MTNNKPFKIIHLSDLHLTKTDNTSRSEPKLFGALKGMNAAFRQIVKDTAVQNSDMVIVTGDVTDRGDIESWRIFWDIIKNAGLTKRTHVIPGNHDVCCLGARLPRFSGKGYADKDLKKVISGLSIGRQSIKFPWVKVLDERVAVFGMNSNNLGNYTALDNAIGELSYYQLLSLADKLRKYRDVPVKIIALHHSPNIPEIKTAKKRGQKPLSNFERLTLQIPEGHRHGLRLLCVTHRVRLIIHGHLHMSEDRRVNGIRIIGAPA
ncbi:MAG: metallophosphoesterase, partial [Anaerohalosphaera sp.]|nr:metallophosphoesterase [Anaerohalosphaera sp.]